MLFMATTCEDDDLTLTCDDYVVSLQALELDIQNLASTSVCTDDFECRSIAFGVQPCGSPRSYIVYSTSIDTLLLANMVNVYNDIEQDFNAMCDVASDCVEPDEPIGFDCVDNACVPLF